MRFTTLSCSLTVGVAAALLAGGIALARREVTERIPADRALIHEVGLELSLELARLDGLYGKDLRALAADMPGDDPFAAIKRCASLHGVRQYSELNEGAKRMPKHVPVAATEPLPQPVVLGAGERAVARNEIRLDREKVFPAGERGVSDTEGWVAPRASSFAVYWLRTADTRAVAILVDLREVGRVTGDFLAPRIAALFAPIRAAGGLCRIEGPGGVRLAGTEPPPARPPDLVVPLPTRLGDFQIVAWDTYRSHAAYHPPTLLVAGTLAAIVVVAGLVLILQQRRAQRLAERRVTFVNRVSHELGTPLTNILLNLELADDLLEDHPAEARRRLALVTEEARRLARLVGNVLTFSRKERGKLVLRPVPCVPDDIIQGVLTQFAPALNRGGIEVVFQAGAAARVVCDADALAQIVANLVSNVKKYAAAGKWLRLESAWNGGQLVVHVADRGPGIPARFRDRVFHPFERVDDGVLAGITGTGLGLAIARDLAELMGGTLRLRPAEEGAAFELRVPASLPL